MPRRVGLVVNPIAGMGGPVGLKGTDDPGEARRLGAEPSAWRKALRFVEAVVERGGDVVWVTAGGSMGEDVLARAGEPAMAAYAPGEPTTPADTRAAARSLVGFDVDLLVFVGGDGTAADVAEAVDGEVPVLGVPAGVKMYSGVFAETPERAAAVALEAEGAAEREVLDIDEAAVRRDRLEVRLAGVLRVPVHEDVQRGKEAGAGEAVEQATLAEAVADRVRDEPGVSHVLGAGTTLALVKAELGFEGTMLGLDVWRDGEVVVADASEADLREVPDPARLWVTPLGANGFVLGRGTQPVTPEVLRRIGVDRVTVVATPSKLDGLDGVRVDAGDPALDEAFPDFVKVVTGHGSTRMVRNRT